MNALERPRLLVGGIDEAMDHVDHAAEPYAVISLLSREEALLYGLPAVDSKICVDHIWIDVRDVPEGWEGAMTEDQAREIAAFVRNLPAVPALYIHCAAGVSRSAAVAAALSRYWTGEDEVWWAEKQPNEHVYALVLDAMGIGTRRDGDSAKTDQRRRRL